MDATASQIDDLTHLYIRAKPRGNAEFVKYCKWGQNEINANHFPIWSLSSLSEQTSPKQVQ